jgi:hypothetical protein
VRVPLWLGDRAAIDWQSGYQPNDMGCDDLLVSDSTSVSVQVGSDVGRWLSRLASGMAPTLGSSEPMRCLHMTLAKGPDPSSTVACQL